MIRFLSTEEQNKHEEEQKIGSETKVQSRTEGEGSVVCGGRSSSYYKRSIRKLLRQPAYQEIVGDIIVIRKLARKQIWKEKRKFRCLILMSPGVHFKETLALLLD